MHNIRYTFARSLIKRGGLYECVLLPLIYIDMYRLLHNLWIYIIVHWYYTIFYFILFYSLVDTTTQRKSSYLYRPAASFLLLVFIIIFELITFFSQSTWCEGWMGVWCVDPYLAVQRLPLTTSLSLCRLATEWSSVNNVINILRSDIELYFTFIQMALRDRKARKKSHRQ